MAKKFVLFLFFSVGMSFIYLCCCSGYLPHFDYQNLDVGFYDRSSRFPNDSMTVFYMKPSEVKFVAGTYMPTVSNPVFGTSCPESGEQGPKNTLTEINITVDQDLDTDHPAGSSLNDLFYHLSGDSIRTLKGDVPVYFDFYYPYDFLLIGTPFVATDTAQTFVFKVRATRSDGSIVEGQLSGVKFQ